MAPFSPLLRPTQSTPRDSHASNQVTLPTIANSEVSSCGEWVARKVRYPRCYLHGVVQHNPGRSDMPSSRKVSNIIKGSSSQHETGFDASLTSIQPKHWRLLRRRRSSDQRRLQWESDRARCGALASCAHGKHDCFCSSSSS